MALDSLLELVETLRSRIDEHGGALRQSEALTRAALIDPLLRELGWDTENPALVMPEYRLGRGYADYALLNDGKPVIMVEAKKLGALLQDAASQGIGYCIEDGIGYFAVTDGGQWEIYETHKMAPIAEKLTVQFDIRQSAPITCLKAMALWRPAVAQGSVTAAETPIVGLDAVKQVAPEPADLPNHEPEPLPQEQPTTQRPPTTVTRSGETSQEWILLSQYEGKEREVPDEIRFPDGFSKGLKKLNEFLPETVQWLSLNGHLNESDCPILMSPRAKNPTVVSQKTDIDPKRKDIKKVGPFWVDTGYSAKDTVRRVKIIIKRVGLDPAKFKVRLG